MKNESIQVALDQIRELVRMLGASTAHASYAVWVVNDKPEQRAAWVEQLRAGLAEYTWITVFGIDGTSAHGIRGYSGLYVVWDAATAYVTTPDEVKTQLALTFTTTMAVLTTMLPHHQLIIASPERTGADRSLECGDD